MINSPTSLSVLAKLCNGQIIGQGDFVVEGICSAEQLVSKQLTFIASAAFAKQVNFHDDVAYIVKPEWQDKVTNGICHEQPQRAFRQILLALTQSNDTSNIASTATIQQSASIGSNVSIGENTVIGENVTIGTNCRIGIGVVIEKNTVIRAGTHIGHRVVIHHETQIGEGCVISEGAVIAGQGFGFSLEGGNWEAIPQVGRVIIGNRVHIGANTCVDRGAINDTIIGNNVIIDNLIHIAHNVQVGDGTAMAAGVGIAGSTKIGKYCLLAGQVGITGHIHIADGVQINGGARVLQSIEQSGTYAGSFHAQPVRKWNRTAVYLKKLETLFKREKKQ